MNQAKWMQGGGALVFFGAGAYFFWNLDWILSGSARMVIASGLLLHFVAMAGAWMHKKGQDLEKAVLAKEQEPGEESLDHGWRKNPFQKGEVSDQVIPRGNFLQKRNRFRKTIERPNSDGY